MAKDKKNDEQATTVLTTALSMLIRGFEEQKGITIEEIVIKRGLKGCKPIITFDYTYE